jgi:hypothetical protein
VRDVNETDPGHLAQLLAMAPDESAGWRAGELAAILRHQLSVPVEFELPRDAGPAGDGQAPAAMPAGVRAIFTTTFADLLRHPLPPLAMLRRVKDFAKACREDPRGPLPREVAMVLYLASILSALTRHGAAMTKLRPDELRKATEWGLAQQWLDDATRSLFEDGLSQLDRPFGVPPPAPPAVPHHDEHGTHGHANL